jgi:hypothetical protein
LFSTSNISASPSEPPTIDYNPAPVGSSDFALRLAAGASRTPRQFNVSFCVHAVDINIVLAVVDSLYSGPSLAVNRFRPPRRSCLSCFSDSTRSSEQTFDSRPPLGIRLLMTALLHRLTPNSTQRTKNKIFRVALSRRLTVLSIPTIPTSKLSTSLILPLLRSTLAPGRLCASS